MPKSAWKSTLVGGLAFTLAVAAIAHLHSNLRDTQERLAQAEEKLHQVEKLATKAAPEKPVTAAPAGPNLAVEELDALRADVTQLKQQWAALASSTGKSGKGEVVDAPAAGAAGDAAAAFGPERVAAIKKVVEDTLKEREDNRRSSMAGMGEEWMRQRRSQSLNELEERLKLSAFQKEQIGTVLEEQSKVVSEMLATMWTGGGGGNREESRKKWQELDATTDTKVKQLLTAQQSSEYDTWKQETGGWGGGMRGGGGGVMIGGGRRSGGRASGGTDDAGNTEGGR